LGRLIIDKHQQSGFSFRHSLSANVHGQS